MSGTLVLVVGQSGAGKDTLMAGAQAAFGDDSPFVFARRAITRTAKSTHEDHLVVTEAGYAEQIRQNRFMLHWRAHDLGYGIPDRYEQDLASGLHVVVNVSRSIIGHALQRFESVLIVEVVARLDLLERRLHRRRREPAQSIRTRLERNATPIPDNAYRIVLRNNGSPEQGVAHLVDILRSLTVDARAAANRKIRGGNLDRREFRRIIGEIVNGKLDDKDVVDFLLATAETLEHSEVVELARVRAEHSPTLDWGSDMVVDKHSMGGVPGNRISLIVVPIVAASGLTIPKMSSRAITSPAGTADTMEVLARVDLDSDEVRHVVRQANGCIVWNGRICHSRVDDVMNALTRPMRINSLNWSVASILSKKIAAGTTHCVIDIPVGSTAKVRTKADARNLQELFHAVGMALGLQLDVRLSEGHAPIGRGIGPALEVRDVLRVLRCEADAPDDLRSKALEFAASILEFAQTGSPKTGFRVATELLESGAAFESLQKIIAAQGPVQQVIRPGSQVCEIPAGREGRVTAIDCFALAGIARAAGAPADKQAGLDLMVKAGDLVAADTPLFRLHSSTETGLARARELAAGNHAYRIRDN